VHVLALRVELHLPGCRTLKDKRSVVRPVVDGIRVRHRVSVAEVGHQDEYQSATVGVALVSGSVRTCEELADEIERFVWSRPDLEVVEIARTWLEDD
jgi:uncharacterized protein YlxP (DUF503 family)